MKTRLVLILITLLCAAMASVQSAHAATIVVTNTNDSGPGSLRNALGVANDGDTIDATGISGIILLTSGELQIDHNVTINGPGAGNLTVDGNATSRVFENFASNVIISGFTITNGVPSDVNGGAGILNHGGLAVSDGGIVNNVAGGSLFGCASGGGINSVGGTLTVTNSVISNNFGNGGGINVDGATVTISGSTINANQAGCGPGGIAIRTGTLTVTNSTISGNTASGCGDCLDGSGGGIGIGLFGSGTATVMNSTISGNSADGFGGGVWVEVGTLTVTNSTISGNSAPPAQGGAIFNQAEATISDTILNAGVSGGTIANAGTFNSLGYNLASDDGGGVLTGPGDQINTDPMLSLLQDNGGPTFTHALLAGSPAINAGNPSFTPPPLYDQRGAPFHRVVNRRVDIGSFEVQAPRVTPTPRPRPTLTPRPAA